MPSSPSFGSEQETTPSNRSRGPDLSLPSYVRTCAFLGLAPDGSPLAVLLRKNSDIDGLDLNLP